MTRTRKPATRPRAREKTDKGKARDKAKAETRATARRARAETEAHQRVFLEKYSTAGVITVAAQLAGIDRKRHYEWLDQPEKYPTYAADFADAHERACDRLEAELFRRGVQGVVKPVFGKLAGESTGSGKIGEITEYSDRLLELLVKSRRPERFRERFEHSGPGGGPIPGNFTIKIDGDHDA